MIASKSVRSMSKSVYTQSFGGLFLEIFRLGSEGEMEEEALLGATPASRRFLLTGGPSAFVVSCLLAATQKKARPPSAAPPR